jgi:DNA-binding winged helix-turn-helix (wHTH) protein
VDVVLLRWPYEQDRREALEGAGRPRLLLVERDVPAPGPVDCLEDWIRLPADEADVRARIDALRHRSTSHSPRFEEPRGSGASDQPSLDEDGVLRFAGRWVSLPPVEARLTAALITRFGAVVSRDQLSRSGWPEGSPGRNALDVHVLRLRRRIAPVGLSIKTVRSRGYLLEGDSHDAPGVDGTAANGPRRPARDASGTGQEAVRNA